MLGKLLKYELKATGRIMLPLMAALIIAGGALALNIRITDKMPDSPVLLTVVLVLLFVAAVIALGVVTVFLVLQRFYKSLLGEEGYLMFTLPVTTVENIASKAITAVIWSFAGVAAGVAAGLVMAAIMNGFGSLTDALGEAWNALIQYLSFEGSARFIILFAVMIILGLLESILKVYAAMAVGQLVGSHRILGAVGAYIIFNIIETILMAAATRLGLMDWLNRVGSSVQQGGGTIFLGTTIVIALLGIAAYGAITWYMLDRRLNLE